MPNAATWTQRFAVPDGNTKCAVLEEKAWTNLTNLVTKTFVTDTKLRDKMCAFEVYWT